MGSSRTMTLGPNHVTTNTDVDKVIKTQAAPRHPVPGNKGRATVMGNVMSATQKPKAPKANTAKPTKGKAPIGNNENVGTQPGGVL